MKKTIVTIVAAFALSACGSGPRGPMQAIPSNDAVAAVSRQLDLKTLATGWSGPFAIAFDRGGDAFVTDDDQNALFEVSHAGKVRKIATGLTNPASVAADAVGDAFVSYDRGVREFFAGGKSRDIPVPCKDAGVAGSQAGVFVLSCRNLYKVLPSGALRKVRSNLPLIGELAVDPAGNFYVSDQYSIVKITANGKASYLTHAVGGRIAADGSGNVYAGVYNVGRGTLYEVKSNGNVAAVRSRLGQIEGVGVDYAGGIYVTSVAIAKVYKVSPGGAAVPFGSSAPFSVAVDARSNLYVADESESTVHEYASDGSVRTIDAGGIPSAVAVDSNDNVYVTDSRTLKRIASNGKITTIASGLNFPEGLAVDAAGNAYVTDGNAVDKFTPSGRKSVILSTSQGPYLGAPSGVAVGPDGTVYVANQPAPLSASSTGAGALYAVAPSGRVQQVSPDITAPLQVAVDRTGTLYVSNYDVHGGRLVRIDRAGNESNVQGVTWPYGVAADGSGNVYVARPGAGMLSEIISK